MPEGAGKIKVPTVAKLPSVAGGAAKNLAEVTFALHPYPGSCLQEMQKPFLKVKASLTVRQVAGYVAKKVPVAPGLEEGGLQLFAAVGGGALPEDLTLGDVSWPAPVAGGAPPEEPRKLRYCLAKEQLGTAKGGSSGSGGAPGAHGDAGGGCIAGAAPGAAVEGGGGQKPAAPPPTEQN